MQSPNDDKVENLERKTLFEKNFGNSVKMTKQNFFIKI